MATATEVKAALAAISAVVQEDLEDEFDVVEKFVNAHLPKPLPNHGKKIGRRDSKEKNLRVGDRVQIVKSCRFGEPVGIVTRDHFSPNRVTVRLPDHGNVEYTPSVYRVTRIEKAERIAANGNDQPTE